MVVDSNQKMLTVQEIIEIAAEQTGSKRPIEEIIQMLTVELTMPNIWKFREGNTLFIFHKSAKPGVGYVRALNADIARNYVNNILEAAKSSYEVGFDTLVTQFTDDAPLVAFKIIARNPPKDMGFAVQRTNGGGYQVTLQVGKPRRGR